MRAWTTKVVVPYTELEPETRRAVEACPLPSRFERVVGLTGYSDLLAGLWAEGGQLIIVEHDVVPWPGALEELADCPEDWCCFGYPPHYSAKMLGCTKFSADLIEATSDCWSQWDFPDWRFCDGMIQTAAESAGFKVHEHGPAVGHVRRWHRRTMRYLAWVTPEKWPNP